VPSDPPSQVQITVTAIGSDRAGWVRSRLRRWHAAALALAVAVLAAVAVISLAGIRSPGVVTPAREAAAVATAFGYPYPMHCLRITTLGSFAHAHVVRNGECARYRDHLNASFHFIAGHWRLVRDEGRLFVPNALLVGTR
jgi:hypothetical protein